MHSNLSLDGSASHGISGEHICLSVDLKDGEDLIENLDQTLAFLGAR